MSNSPKKDAAMKAKELQDLIDFIAKSGLNKVNIETEEFKISVQREPNTKVVSSHIAAAPAAATPAAPAPAASNHQPLKAPMIGTFYRSSSPESPVFVNVGDVVEK